MAKKSASRGVSCLSDAMDHQPTMGHSSLPAEPTDCRSGGLWSAVGFWLTAFCATAIVGAIVLSPRLLLIKRLEQVTADLVSQCRRLDHQNENLARLLQALRHDPKLLEQLAEWELQGRPSDRMPALLVDALELPETPARPRLTLADRLLVAFATDRLVIQVGFATAAVLYVLALVCYRGRPVQRPAADTHHASVEPLRPVAALRDERDLCDDECLF